MKIFNWIFKWFSRTKFWLWFSNTILSGTSYRIKGHPEFPMEKYEEEILPALEASDLEGRYMYAFTCADTKSLTKLLITLVSGSFFSHAGLIYPDHRHLVHMLGKGITQNHILNELKEIDNFAIMRFPLTDAEYVEYQRRVEKYIRLKVPYDFQQELDDGVTKMYCSELVWKVGRGLVDNENFKPREELGRLIFEPDDVYKNGEIIFEHRI